jgi:hypothetical protein
MLSIIIVHGNNIGNNPRINIYDEFGENIYSETKEINTENNKLEFQINFKNYSNGVYFYTFESGARQGSGKIVIVK